MKNLLSYLNGMPTQEQQEFARRAGTSIGYLRKAISKGQRISEGLVIKLERESAGAVRCEDLRPDVDWAYLSKRRHEELAASDPTTNAGQSAGQGVANA